MTMTAAQPMMKDQSSIKLPCGRLLGTVGLVSVLFGSGWFLIAQLGPWPMSYGIDGILGTAVSLCVSVVGILVMTPWKTRPIESWMTFWLGATVLRLLATPVVAYVLYSATSRSLTPFMLSVAASYLVILFSEAGVLALYVKQVTDRDS